LRAIHRRTLLLLERWRRTRLSRFGSTKTLQMTHEHATCYMLLLLLLLVAINHSIRINVVVVVVVVVVTAASRSWSLCWRINAFHVMACECSVGEPIPSFALASTTTPQQHGLGIVIDIINSTIRSTRLTEVPDRLSRRQYSSIGHCSVGLVA
jgi:hypothetical protein